MPYIADIFREHIDAYPYPLTEVQRHAVHDICTCRTPQMKHWAVYSCPKCGETHFAYPSCGNRNCPKCGQDKVAKFLTKQQQNLLPVNYFMITVTMPPEMHGVCRRQARFGAGCGGEVGAGRRQDQVSHQSTRPRSRWKHHRCTVRLPDADQPDLHRASAAS